MLAMGNCDLYLPREETHDPRGVYETASRTGTTIVSDPSVWHAPHVQPMWLNLMRKGRFQPLQQIIRGKNCYAICTIIIFTICHVVSQADIAFEDERAPQVERYFIHEESSRDTFCQELCEELGTLIEPQRACKRYSRTLPHPKIGRICTNKFRQAHTFVCSSICYR